MDLNDRIWNPWHGCHKCSEGCQNCYAYFLDKRYGRDTNEVLKNKSDFTLPIKKDRAGNWKLPSGSFVRVCMASDFFIEEADAWRIEAWDMIRRRSDVTFSLLTKRAERIRDCLPSDWGDGWDNVSFSVSCENQKRLEQRLPCLLDLPAKHRWVSLKPFIGEIDIADYLATGKIETVLAGGENYLGSRPLHYEWVEKGEQVLCVVQHGEIRGNSGARSDFTIIETMITEGFTPHQILDCNFAFRRYTKEIREAYFRKRFKETPPFREVKVHYIVGASGSGKSHTYVDLCKEQGDDAIYMLSDYSTNGGFDLYNGEPILFMDEYKAQLRYDTLLSIMDGYKKQLHARYSNIHMLWNDAYISTVYPPEELYDLMVPENRQSTDTYTQLKRRITDITYCWTDGTDYHRYTIPMSAYKDYISLQNAAKRSISAETAPIPSLFDGT